MAPSQRCIGLTAATLSSNERLNDIIEREFVKSVFDEKWTRPTAKSVDALTVWDINFV